MVDLAMVWCEKQLCFEAASLKGQPLPGSCSSKRSHPSTEDSPAPVREPHPAQCTDSRGVRLHSRKVPEREVESFLPIITSRVCKQVVCHQDADALGATLHQDGKLNDYSALPATRSSVQSQAEQLLTRPCVMEQDAQLPIAKRHYRVHSYLGADALCFDTHAGPVVMQHGLSDGLVVFLTAATQPIVGSRDASTLKFFGTSMMLPNHHAHKC